VVILQVEVEVVVLTLLQEALEAQVVVGGEQFSLVQRVLHLQELLILDLAEAEELTAMLPVQMAAQVL
jgi:hypothetical protein